MGSLREALSIERNRLFVGRQAELSYADDWLNTPNPPTKVVFVSGMGGVGKSTLLHRFLNMAQDAGLFCLWFDGRASTATPAGFLDAISYHLVGKTVSKFAVRMSMSEIAKRISRQRTLLCIDNYDHFQQIDGWLRDGFFPELPATGLLIVLAARQDMALDWKNHLAWKTRVKQMPLAPLTRLEAAEYYANRGVHDGSKVDLYFRETKGLPLAMALSVENAKVIEPTLETRALSLSRMVSAALLREVATPELQEIIDVLCILPHANQDQLNRLLERPVITKQMEQLSRLSFVRPTVAGFALHDVARSHLSEDFVRRQPERHQRLLRRIVDDACRRLKTADSRDKSRIAADLLSICRDAQPLRAFLRFSPDPLSSVMDTFRSGDLPHLHRLVTEQGQMAISLERERIYQLLDGIANQFPDTIRVFRSTEGIPMAFTSGLLLYRETLDLLEQFIPQVLKACFKEEVAQLKQLRLEQADTFYQLLGAATKLDPHHSFEELNGILFTDTYSNVAAVGVRTVLVTQMQELKTVFQSYLGYHMRPLPGLPADHPAHDDVVLELDFRNSDFVDWVRFWLQLEPQPSPPGSSTLSTREVQVVKLICQGLSNSEIGLTLVISRRTVDAHLRRIFEKAGVSSRTALVRWAMEMGINPDEQ